MAFEVIHGALDLQRKSLNGLLLFGGIQKIVVRQLQTAGKVKCLTSTHHHLTITIPQMDNGHAHITSIETGGKVTQRQLGDIDLLELQVCVVYQCNQLLNQGFTGRHQVHQGAPAPGSIFGKSKHIGDRFGGTEIKKVFQFPLQGVRQLRVLNTFRPFHLENLVLLNGQNQRGGGVCPAMTGDKFIEGLLALGWHTLSKSGGLTWRPGGHRPGDAIGPNLQTKAGD